MLSYLRTHGATASYQTFLEEAKKLHLVTENFDPLNLGTNQSAGVRLGDIIHWFDALHTSSMDASSRLQQESERAISSIKMLLVAATARQQEFDALKKKPKLSRKRRRDEDESGKARRTTTERQRHRNSNEASSAFVGTSRTVTTAETHDNDCRKGSTVASNFPQQQNINSCENRNAQNQYSLHFQQQSLNIPLTPSPREMGGKELQHHEKVQHRFTQHLHALRDDDGTPQQQNQDYHIEVAGPGDERGAAGTRRHESGGLPLNSRLDDAGPPPLAPPPRFMAFGSIFEKRPHSLSLSPSCRNRSSFTFMA